MREALQQIAALQPEALKIIRENGFVWENKESLGKEPGNWQHLSFTLYSMLCEAESIASSALKEDE